jgi:hypothetical protein
MLELKKEYDLKEALHGEIVTTQALIDLLIQKGFIAQEELLQKIKTIQAQIGKSNN